MNRRWLFQSRISALVFGLWLASLGNGAEGCTAGDCEGLTEVLDAASESLEVPSGAVGAAALEGGAPGQVYWVASAGRDGRWLDVQDPMMCENVATALGLEHCSEAEPHLWASGSEKVAEEQPHFSIRGGRHINSSLGCVDLSRLGEDGLPLHQLRGWNTIAMGFRTGGGESDLFRFVENVRNLDTCSVIDCSTLERADLPCHKFRLTAGMVVDGEPQFAEGHSLLPTIPFWDYERTQLALPDLVPVLPTENTFEELLVTECAYASGRAVELGLAPRILGIRLRFSSAFANLGHGPLELRTPGGSVPDESGAALDVEQVFYAYGDPHSTWPYSNGAELTFHPGHDHYHLSTIYGLTVNNPDNLAQGPETIRKLGFCIEETTDINDRSYRYERAGGLSGSSPVFERYRLPFADLRVSSPTSEGFVEHDLGRRGCRLPSQVPVTTQGLLPGGVDVYTEDLAGQAVDPLSFPGARRLRFTVELDPDNRIIELNEYNNSEFFDIDVERFRFPTERVIRTSEGEVDLWDPRTQSTLAMWCEERAVVAASSPNDFHRRLTSCALPMAFEGASESDTCFDYADCDQTEYESGVGRCIPNANTGNWQPVRCIEVEGAYKLAFEGTRCEPGDAHGVCSEAGEWTPCE